MPRDIKKMLKVRNEISTIKLVFKSCKAFAKNYFMNKFFSKIGTCSQKNILVIETHLTVP